jgi:WD40 repeat protein
MFFGHYDSVRALADLDNFGQNNYFASGSDDKTIKVWDALKGELKCEFKKVGDGVIRIKFASSGSLIAASTLDSLVKVY